MPQWLDSLFHFVFSSASLGTIISCAAVAIAILMPPALTVFLPQLRLYAIIVAVAAFSFTSIAGKFYNDGLSVKQAQWDAAVKSTLSVGEKARDDAERSVGNSNAGSVPNDGYDRDNP